MRVTALGEGGVFVAITDETVRLARALRIRLDREVDNVTAQLVMAWARAWNELVHEWETTTAELITIAVDGRWPSRRKVLRNAKVVAALERTRRAIEDLGRTTGVTITGTLPHLTAFTADWVVLVPTTPLPSTLSP